MTLGSFVVRNTFRNKRRSLLTMISISFSLLLLTMMICIWRSFYVDQVAPEASRRLIIRDRVSLAFFLPAFYREKIRSVPGVTSVVPITWFGGRYIDDRPEHFFAQMGTDPDEYLKVASDKIVPPDQVKAWQQDRAGALVDVTLANKYGWKIGDHVTLQANIFPTNLDLTIRGIYHRDPPQNALYFNAKYLEEAVPWFKGQAGWYAAQIDSADDVSRASSEIDGMFRNSPLQTKTESEKAFQLGFVASLGKHQSIHPRHLRRSRVHHHAGFGQHHGDVGAQPDARGGSAENAGLHSPTGAVDLRERIRGSRRCRRSAWGTGGDSRDCVSDAQFHRAGNTAQHEGPRSHGGTVAAGFPGTRAGKWILAGVQRIAHEHCRRFAPHRLS